jgi:hypothetical protein
MAQGFLHHVHARALRSRVIEYAMPGAGCRGRVCVGAREKAKESEGVPFRSE